MPQFQRRPNRRDKKQTQVRKALGVLIALCLVVGGASYLYVTARSEIRPVDEKTLCPTDAKGASSITAILIDRTDTFNPTQQAAIRDRLNEVKDHSSRYDQIEIYAVEPTQETLLKPEFSMCNPGRGDDVNKWTANPHLLEERWQALFATPLQHLLDVALDGGTAQISPIMESIQSIVVTTLGAQEAVDKKIPRRLIIISDLLQYTKNYSQYQPLAPFSQFKKLPYYQGVRSDLTGISVEFWYVRRQSTLNLQKEKHVDFWHDYIADQGGTIDKIWYVPGT